MTSDRRPEEVASAPSPVPRDGESLDTSQGGPAVRERNAVLGSQQDPSVPTPSPKLQLHFEDLAHDGSKVFLKYVPDPYEVFNSGLSDIVKFLYSPPRCCDYSSSPTPGGGCIVHFEPCIPPTESVTLVLVDFDGVAYTFGQPADPNRKEIHFSLSYVAGRSRLADPRAELVGVIVHELVHCYQHTVPKDSEGVPSPPGGLIEGLADFVRLKAGLAPPHWKRPTSSADLPESWDVGYEQTAYFLEWIEDIRIGTGAIGMVNDRLLRVGYVGGEGKAHTDDSETSNSTQETGNEEQDENENRERRKSPEGQGFWIGLFGVGVLKLWKEYGEYLDRCNEATMRN